ncbi:MAG: AAA family ATPase [Thermoleophilaceae bacterium]
MTEPSTSTLRGRRSELETVAGLLDDVRSGRSRALLVSGETGVGKTALLEHLVAQASDCLVVRATGVESEMEVPFAGLHQLVRPLLDHIGALPVPQHNALEVAFGRAAGTAPDRFLIGLAVVSLVSAAAQQHLLLGVVDDAQWLDRASAQTLGFVARRLPSEPVALIFGARAAPAITELAGLQELRVKGLPDSESRAMIRAALPGPIDEPVLARIVAEARGNPLALMELPRGMTPSELAGGFGLPDPDPRPTRIERSFLRRVEQMPVATQRLLLIAAAEPVGDPALLRRAAGQLGLNVDSALGGAEHMIEVTAQVRFRHPLVRSAVYRVAPAAVRRQVHAALAESIAPDVDPDRRAWHRAHAAAGRDEAVAAELEASAERAQVRGGLAAAAAFLERAVALTPDPKRRAQRALAAARAAHASGSAEAALALLDTAEQGPLDEPDDARRQLLAAQISFSQGRGCDSASQLVAAARRVEALDGMLARATYLEAIWAASFSSRLGTGGGQLAIWAAARAAPPAREPRSPADLMLVGLATRFAEGYPAGAPTLQRALATFRREAKHGLGDLPWAWLAVDLWDDGAWFELGARQLQMARDAGALSVLALALHTLAGWHVLVGELTAAEALLAEAESIVRATGQTLISHAGLALAALRGGDGQAFITSTMRDATPRGDGILVRHAEHAAATLYNGLGQYDDALQAAQLELERNPTGFHKTALPELVEAAVRSNEPELARSALDRLSEQTQASGTNWARSVEARSRALLSEGREADALYRSAIALLEGSRLGVERARARLVYGEWLRREGRRGDARAELRAAYDWFTAAGAGPFAERAGRELRAVGERPRAQRTEVAGTLTLREAEIARLAREGASNPDIGARLFISPRTVEYHLAKVYAKLGITSRNQLPDALASKLVSA